MPELVRHEHFVPGFKGERLMAAFWIAGSLKAIEARARRENGPNGHKPSGFELLVAIGIALIAAAIVFTLV